GADHGEHRDSGHRRGRLLCRDHHQQNPYGGADVRADWGLRPRAHRHQRAPSNLSGRHVLCGRRRVVIHPDEVVAIEIMRPGPAGDGVTSGEATQILEAIDAFQSPTIPQNLGDLNNVNVPSPSNGQVLTYVTANIRWQAATPANLIVEEDSGETVVNSSARRLLIRNGVAASQSGVVRER